MSHNLHVWSPPRLAGCLRASPTFLTLCYTPSSPLRALWDSPVCPTVALLPSAISACPRRCGRDSKRVIFTTTYIHRFSGYTVEGVFFFFWGICKWMRFRRIGVGGGGGAREAPAAAGREHHLGRPRAGLVYLSVSRCAHTLAVATPPQCRTQGVIQKPTAVSVFTGRHVDCYFAVMFVSDLR